MSERRSRLLPDELDRRTLGFGVLGGVWGSLLFVMLVLVGGIRTLFRSLFGAAYPVVLAVLALGFGVFVGLAFAELDGEVTLG